MIDLPEGIFTGVLNNFGDLPFHLSVISGFAFGNNFPPEDPTYAGVRFTYPFLTDFVSAIFVRCGADLRQSMFIENFVVGVGLCWVAASLGAGDVARQARRHHHADTGSSERRLRLGFVVETSNAKE